MSGQQVFPPFQVFTDEDGDPLENGYIYVGQENLNPQVAPIQVFWDPALTILAAQPIRTLGGYPVRNGTPSRFYVDQAIYSITVKNKKGELVFSLLDAQNDLTVLLEGEDGAGAVGYRFDASDAVKRDVADKLDERFSPLDFGAVGDGVTNDGPALNKAFAYLRSRLSDTSVAITLDLSGRTYATDISVNATGLISWGWAVQNGTIKGRCVGKAVLDMVGSRGGHLRDLVIDGDQASMPRVGIQAARGLSGAFAFCDNMLWDNVTTQGYFSLAGVHLYGQETTTYQHCRFWNYFNDGFAAIHTGFSSFVMNSDYLQPMTGPTSYINNKYLNCDYRYLPVGAAAAITGISKANPAVVTSAGHPFSNGQTVVIGTVLGMTEINNVSAVVQNATSNTFELAGVNSTAFTAYSGGGVAAVAQTLPTVYLARGEQQHFDTCYIVNYGTHSVQLDLIDTSHDPKSIWFDCLFEGAGSISHLEFTNVVGIRNLFDFKLLTYNIHARDYVMGHTGSGTDVVSLYTTEISAPNRSASSAPLLDLYGKFALFGAQVATINTGMFDPGNMGVNFTGVASWLNGQSTHYNSNYVSYLDGVYTPVVTASVGAITAYTATGYQRRVGNVVFFNATVAITDNGTGSGVLRITLPANSSVDAVVIGQQTNTTGLALVGSIAPASNLCQVVTHANAYPVATGTNIKISGTYVL